MKEDEAAPPSEDSQIVPSPPQSKKRGYAAGYEKARQMNQLFELVTMRAPLETIMRTLNLSERQTLRLMAQLKEELGRGPFLPETSHTLIRENLSVFDAAVARLMAIAISSADPRTKIVTWRQIADITKDKANYQMSVGLVKKVAEATQTTDPEDHEAPITPEEEDRLLQEHYERRAEERRAANKTTGAA